MSRSQGLGVRIPIRYKPLNCKGLAEPALPAGGQELPSLDLMHPFSLGARRTQEW